MWQALPVRNLEQNKELQSYHPYNIKENVPYFSRTQHINTVGFSYGLLWNNGNHKAELTTAYVDIATVHI
jgi:hypothetical protein